MSTSKKPLKDRMKMGELYVVFSGLDDEGMGLLSYGYPAGVPRIYSKEALDPRVSEQHPICTSIESAHEHLSSETRFVVLPLSTMIEWWDKFEVRRWATPQRSVDPKVVREYVSNWESIQAGERTAYSDKYREALPRQIVRDHKTWIDSHLDGTMADPLEYLEFVRFEMQRYEPEELIVDHFDDLGLAGEYLATWGEPDDDDDEPHDFEYRLANLDEDIQHVDEVIAFLGDSFNLADLQRLAEESASSSLKLAN